MSQFKPPMPKRALTPFFLFKSQIYQQIRNKHPGLRPADYTCLATQLWQKMTPEQRDVYFKRFQKNKQQSEMQMKAYQLRFGSTQSKMQRKRKAIKRIRMTNLYRFK